MIYPRLKLYNTIIYLYIHCIRIYSDAIIIRLKTININYEIYYMKCNAFFSSTIYIVMASGSIDEGVDVLRGLGQKLLYRVCNSLPIVVYISKCVHETCTYTIMYTSLNIFINNYNIYILMDTLSRDALAWMTSICWHFTRVSPIKGYSQKVDKSV